MLLFFVFCLWYTNARPRKWSHKIATAHKKCHQFPNRSYFLLLGFAFQCCDTVRYIFVCVAFIHFMISVDLFCCCCFPHAHFSLTYRACIECARFRAIANVLSWNVRTLLLFFSRRIFLSLYIFFLTLQFSMHFQVVITLHFFSVFVQVFFWFGMSFVCVSVLVFGWHRCDQWNEHFSRFRKRSPEEITRK